MSFNAYSDIQLSGDVELASSHQLILLLYQKCLQQILAAKHAINENNIDKKFKALRNATDIVDYLRTCLVESDSSTTALVKQLRELYDFLEKTLLEVALKNDIESLDRAEKIVVNIKEGWDGIADRCNLSLMSK